MPNSINAKALLRMGVDMSEGTIQNVINRISDALSVPADEIKEHIRLAAILNADETSQRYMGKNVWLWTFYDPLTGRNYFVIDRTRSAKVPTAIIGDGENMTVVCDGWLPYKKYTKQRCILHLIREVKNKFQKNPDCKQAKYLLERMRKIYHDAKEILEHPPDHRKRYKKNLEVRMRRIIKKYKDDPLLCELIGKLHRALPDMFRFVLDPRIPSTNNLAEQSIWELIIQGKIRGCLRSDKTMKRKGDLYTCITTWKNMKQDYLAEIAKYV